MITFKFEISRQSAKFFPVFLFVFEIVLNLFRLLSTFLNRCDTLLSEFLKAIKSDPTSTKMSEMCNILINHAQSTNALIQFTAIDWIGEFVQLSGAKMLKFASGIFTAILPCLAYEGESRKGNANCVTSFVANPNQLRFISQQRKLTYLVYS